MERRKAQGMGEPLFPEELGLQSPTAALMELRRVALHPDCGWSRNFRKYEKYERSLLKSLQGMILWEQEEGTTGALQFEHILEPVVIRAQFNL